MWLLKRTKTTEIEMAQAVHPPTGQVRQLSGEEVAQARAEARRQFERILPAAQVRAPKRAMMDRWWPSA